MVKIYDGVVVTMLNLQRRLLVFAGWVRELSEQMFTLTISSTTLAGLTMDETKAKVECDKLTNGSLYSDITVDAGTAKEAEEADPTDCC